MFVCSVINESSIFFWGGPDKNEHPAGHDNFCIYKQTQKQIKIPTQRECYLNLIQLVRRCEPWLSFLSPDFWPHTLDSHLDYWSEPNCFALESIARSLIIWFWHRSVWVLYIICSVTVVWLFRARKKLWATRQEADLNSAQVHAHTLSSEYS